MPLERIYPSQGLDPLTLSLIEPFCISYHGIERSKTKAGDKVLVVGGGSIGILAAVAAKAKGGVVFVADVSPAKLELAKKFGVDGIVNASEQAAYQHAVDEFTDGDGFDVTVEAVGLPATFQSCIDTTAFGGNVVVIGVSGQSADFAFTVIQKKELNIFGSRNSRKSDFEQVIEMVKSSGINLSTLVTDTYSWQNAEQAFFDFDKHAGGKLKVMLDFT
jgi:2-desacetyl-2-hydroxyethyl bacteriochlorophyllide A dehydrogenase